MSAGHGVTWRVFLRGRLVGVGQQSAPLQASCTINVRLTGFTVSRSAAYVATFDLNDVNGEELERRLTIRGT